LRRDRLNPGKSPHPRPCYVSLSIPTVVWYLANMNLLCSVALSLPFCVVRFSAATPFDGATPNAAILKTSRSLSLRSASSVKRLLSGGSSGSHTYVSHSVHISLFVFGTTLEIHTRSTQRLNVVCLGFQCRGHNTSRSHIRHRSLVQRLMTFSPIFRFRNVGLPRDNV
jgi:hypothetical protein